MSLEERARYEDLLAHIEHHDVRRWLMEGAKREDARRIRAAIERLSDGQLQRRLARMLAKGGHGADCGAPQRNWRAD